MEAETQVLEASPAARCTVQDVRIRSGLGVRSRCSEGDAGTPSSRVTAAEHLPRRLKATQLAPLLFSSLFSLFISPKEKGQTLTMQTHSFTVSNN